MLSWQKASTVVSPAFEACAELEANAVMKASAHVNTQWQNDFMSRSNERHCA